MLFLKYLGIFVFLLLLHTYLDNGWMIAAWCLLGILSGTWLKEARYPLLTIPGLELTIGLLYWELSWGRNDSLQQLAVHSGTSVLLWATGAIAVNLITACLCTSLFLLLTRKFVKHPVSRHSKAPAKEKYAIL